MRQTFIAAALLFVAVSDSRAGTIINGSFEAGSVNPGSSSILLNAGSTAVTGWTVGTGSVDIVGTFWQASNGVRSVDLNGLNAGSIFQVISTTPGQVYDVSFDMAANTGLFPPVPPVTMSLRVTAASASQNYSFSTSGHSYSNMGWQTNHFLFTATSTSTTLTFTSLSISTGSAGPTLDNVQIAEIPEPSSVVLGITGIAGFAGYRASRRLRRATQ